MDIKLNLPTGPFTGQVVTFKTPCACDKVTNGLSINDVIYTVCDANKQSVTGKSGVWSSGAYVSVVLDCAFKKAYILNNNNYASGDYGLGTNSGASGSTVRFDTATDLDDLTKNGFWSYYKKNTPLESGCAETESVGGYTITGVSGLIVQRAVTKSGVWIERIKNGLQGWGPWEYINPPMSAGVEYRTTERWNGKAVYTKLVSVGALPNNSSKSVATGATASGIFRTHLIVYAAEGNVLESPYFTSDGTLKIKHNVSNNGALSVYTTDDYSGATGYCQIWYTKD